MTAQPKYLRQGRRGEYSTQSTMSYLETAAHISNWEVTRTGDCEINDRFQPTTDAARVGANSY
jgi:hypothetical protein